MHRSISIFLAAISSASLAVSAPPPAPKYGYTNLRPLDNYVAYPPALFSDPAAAKGYIDQTFGGYKFVFVVDPQELYCKADVAPFRLEDFVEAANPSNNAVVLASPKPAPYELPTCDVTRPSDGWCIHASCLPAPPPSTYEMYGVCPANSRFRSKPAPNHCDCAPRMTWSSAASQCVPYRDRYHDAAFDKPGDVCYGNPIFPLTGVKAQPEPLISKPIALSALYSTRSRVANVQKWPDWEASPPVGPPSLGELWTTSLHKSLFVDYDSGSTVWALQAVRGNGRYVSFLRQTDQSYVADAGVSDRLARNGFDWRYYDTASNSIEIYQSAYNSTLGKLQNITHASGRSMTYVYSVASTASDIAPAAGLLIGVVDNFGREVSFRYEAGGQYGPRVKQITDGAGAALSLQYDTAGNLAAITWPDGSVKRYLYERIDLPWALTGIVDENSKRFSQYSYDSGGRVNGTQLAGGTNFFTLSHTSPPSWNIVETYDSNLGIVWRDRYWQPPSGTTVTTPLGNTLTIDSVLTAGGSRLSAQSQPAGSGCAASTRAMSYDANGNVAAEDDFNGARVCRLHDLGRNLETTRIEGLASTTTCSSVTGIGATLPTGSRKVSVQWHPDWRWETKKAEPLRVTTWVYNGQPDPFNGGAISTCAPTGAVLPDGKPVVVLCKKVEQATTDANGGQGFSAALQVGVPYRQQTWTYNQIGQALSATDPLGRVTNYAYYPTSSSDYAAGDLKQVTNAVGQTTSYTKYNKNGQVLRTIDANGLVSDYTYDARQRLTSSAAGGLQTNYGYDFAGQLTTLTLPDTTKITYVWDDAHRLTKVTDQAGNSVTYTLDDAGNQKVEQIKDASGTLARTVTRVFDALNRVQESTGSDR